MHYARGLMLWIGMLWAATVYAQDVALIIGIADYPYCKKLESPVKDGQALAEILQERYGYTIRELYDDKASRREILNAIKQLAKESRKTGDASACGLNSVIIYYAGHGVQDELLNEGYWLPYDAQAEETGSQLANTELKKYLAAIRARQLLLVSDSCFSGLLLDRVEDKGRQHERAVSGERDNTSGTQNAHPGDGALCAGQKPQERGGKPVAQPGNCAAADAARPLRKLHLPMSRERPGSSGAGKSEAHLGLTSCVSQQGVFQSSAPGDYTIWVQPQGIDMKAQAKVTVKAKEAGGVVVTETDATRKLREMLFQQAESQYRGVQYAVAVQSYSEAIGYGLKSLALYQHRALCYESLCKWVEAIADYQAMLGL